MYTPKYVSMNDIPVQIPDDYSQAQKRDAIETAEASIELDLKDGDELNDDELYSSVVTAIKQKATCELIRGSPHPDDVSLGDLDDRGDTKLDYADSFCQNYQDLVESILEAELIGGGGADRLGPYVYTTRKPE